MTADEESCPKVMFPLLPDPCRVCWKNHLFLRDICLFPSLLAVFFDRICLGKGIFPLIPGFKRQPGLCFCGLGQAEIPPGKVRNPQLSRDVKQRIYGNTTLGRCFCLPFSCSSVGLAGEGLRGLRGCGIGCEPPGKGILLLGTSSRSKHPPKSGTWGVHPAQFQGGRGWQGWLSPSCCIPGSLGCQSRECGMGRDYLEFPTQVWGSQ